MAVNNWVTAELDTDPTERNGNGVFTNLPWIWSIDKDFHKRTTAKRSWELKFNFNHKRNKSIIHFLLISHILISFVISVEIQIYRVKVT